MLRFWPHAIALLFASYFPLAIWLDRSYVSTTPKGSITFQLIMPFEIYKFASLPHPVHLKRLNELGDDPSIEGGETRSPLIIYEDGRPLGPAHNTFADINNLGAGRFSHFTDKIIFSSSDNSDPNTNKRMYWAVIP
jgi:hypothetical protein